MPKPPPLYDGAGHWPVVLIPGTVLPPKTLLAYEPHTCTVSLAYDVEQKTSNASIAAAAKQRRASERTGIIGRRTVADQGQTIRTLTFSGTLLPAESNVDTTTCELRP